MSKKKKEKVEDPKKGKAAKEVPASAVKAKKNIVPASLPVLVQSGTPSAKPVATPPASAAKPKKAPAKKKKVAPAAKKGKEVEIVEVAEIVITNDEIALRAYFLGEKRRQHGHWGDEAGDWIEAERQLREEAGKK